MILIIDMSYSEPDVQPLKHREMSDRKKLLLNFIDIKPIQGKLFLQPIKIV